MIFGLTIEKLLLIGLVAALILGPERLPRYAESLAQFTKRAREWVSTAKTRVRDEMGEDFDDVDWRTLDPRQYDPRRIVREALMEDEEEAAAEREKAAPPQQNLRRLTPGQPAPFDSEAT